MFWIIKRGSGPDAIVREENIDNWKGYKNYEVHKRTDNIATSDYVVKGTDEVHKCNDTITTNEEVDKGTEILEDMKEAVVTICKKDLGKF